MGTTYKNLDNDCTYLEILDGHCQLCELGSCRIVGEQLTLLSYDCSIWKRSGIVVAANTNSSKLQSE